MKDGIMPKDNIRKAYMFDLFDFEEFSKGKVFLAVNAKDKYKWDKVNKRETDEWEGVLVEVEIIEDNYDYAKSGQPSLTGINENIRFDVLIKDGNLDEILEKYVPSRLEKPVPIKIKSDMSRLSSFGDSNGGTLRVYGDIFTEEEFQSNEKASFDINENS
jgi:hypothetical protein